MPRRSSLTTKGAFTHKDRRGADKTTAKVDQDALLSRDTALTHYAITVQWRFVWFRIIAKYWSDESFKAQIDASLNATDDGAAIRRLIKEEFDLDIGDQVVLRFYEPQGVSFSGPDASGELPDDPWGSMPPMEVKMPIPPRPDDEALHAIALASFTGSGRSYPFTCA